MANNIYLDYAAATPLDPKVKDAMEPYWSEDFYNPSATYLAGRRIRKALEQARQDVASVLSVRPAEIIFTAGATEANNLAIQGLMRSYQDGEVLVSATEHDSVLAPASLFTHRRIPVDRYGQVILNKLSNLISDRTILISVIFVNNETGTVSPLRDLAKIAQEIRRTRLSQKNMLPLFFHTDAAQAPNYFDLNVHKLGVDLMSLNGSKIYGPKQSGALYINRTIRLKPLILGGGQESGRRSGTENMAAIVGFAKALTLAKDRRKVQKYHVSNLRDQMANGFSQFVPSAIINGHPTEHAPHILSVTFPGFDNERLMMELDEAGIQCAVGSACSAAKDEASHVLATMGLAESAIRSSLRFSFGKNTTPKDIKVTLARLRTLTGK
ncbi:MAG: cysteine desulfurase family protein [Candidatus Saccharimonadales bacterium]